MLLAFEPHRQTKYFSLAHINLRLQKSRDVLQAFNWIFKFSKLSLMMTRSSAYRSSQGQLIRHSRERESFHHNSKKVGDLIYKQNLDVQRQLLQTSPWNSCIPLLLSLHLSYITVTSLTIHSSIPNFLKAHQRMERGTQSKAFSMSTKAK